MAGENWTINGPCDLLFIVFETNDLGKVREVQHTLDESPKAIPNIPERLRHFVGGTTYPKFRILYLQRRTIFVKCCEKFGAISDTSSVLVTLDMMISVRARILSVVLGLIHISTVKIEL